MLWQQEDGAIKFQRKPLFLNRVFGTFLNVRPAARASIRSAIHSVILASIGEAMDQSGSAPFPQCCRWRLIAAYERSH